MIYKTLLLFLFFVQTLNAASTAETNGAYIALEKKIACAASEKEAIVNVDAILEKTTGIHSRHLYSKNVYIRHNKNSEGSFCVEGIVTQSGFDLYAAELAEEYECIMGDLEDINDSVSYTQKNSEIERLNSDIASYNQKIVAAEKLAPLKAVQIEETKASLNTMVNATPVVKFRVSGCESNFAVGCKLLFVSSLEDDSANIVYRWNFGDGTYSRRTNPIHYFKEAGSYKVSLRITDDGKKSTEFSQELHVSARPKARVDNIPNAVFSTHKTVYMSGETVDFTNLSSTGKSKITDFKWNFGDGENSKLPNPTHNYYKTGAYKVHLEITNSEGLKSDVVKNVQIVHPAILFGTDGRKFNRVVRKFGQPNESIEKEGTLTHAYRYGSDWLLIKQNKVECRIKGSAFRTNLMGNPKNCNWYEKHAESAMYVLNQ